MPIAERHARDVVGSLELPVRFYVEQSPNGTWRVMVRGEWAPVSVHDTEEEARERLAAYLRGVAAEPAQDEP